MTVELQHERVEPLARVLSRAFAADPYMAHVLPDAGRRAAVLSHMMAASIRYALAHGRVDVLPDLAGVAVWLAPGSTAVTVPRMLRARGGSVPLRMGPRGARRMLAHDRAAEQQQTRDVPGPHWYLWVLGVEPAHAGRGRGSDLLHAGLARADTDGLPAYLKTENARNLSTYRRNGFELATATTGPTGLRTWTMRRDPGT